MKKDAKKDAKEYVWYYIPMNCFVISDKKLWGVRPPSLDFNMPARKYPSFISSAQFLFLGAL